ncbi:hypothetical protein OIE68_22810 [Nocardia vinacea]|uniref:hypothetical protein n=1 Tax=Nocardia vinacea TaxID=96468 RepID=UPI002E121418|nr:hypothetical protein OIE68_22810 [Nocardia vinacea]
MHLSVFLHGARFDFAACLTAALIFVREHPTQHYVDAVTVDLCDTGSYPRLPSERPYLAPQSRQ